MNNFYYGKDDHSAREIVMTFGTPCFNTDIDGLQYDYDANGKVIFVCVLEYKHPFLSKLTVKSIEVQREHANLLNLPLFVLSYFTKPGTEPGDGYGTIEQPAMFYVIPGNKKAHKAMSWAPGKQWYTPFELAKFMHQIRRSNVSAAELDHLSNEYKEYHRKTKVDSIGLLAAFKGDKL